LLNSPPKFIGFWRVEDLQHSPVFHVSNLGVLIRHIYTAEGHISIGSDQDLPPRLLPDNYADVVFCVNVLNHVQDPDKVLSEIARIMKPKGKLYFDVHNNPRSVGHPHAFTQKSVCLLLKRHFKVERMIEQDKIKSISYDIYCADCGYKLRLRDRVCPRCKGEGKRIKGPRVYTVSKTRFYKSKPKMWGSICLPLKS